MAALQRGTGLQSHHLRWRERKMREEEEEEERGEEEEDGEREEEGNKESYNSQA